MRLVILSGVLLMSAATAGCASLREPVTVSLCDIARNPRAYDGRAVVTSGLYATDMTEISLFYDPACEDTEFSILLKDAPESERQDFYRALRDESLLTILENRYSLAVEGRFLLQGREHLIEVSKVRRFELVVPDGAAHGS